MPCVFASDADIAWQQAIHAVREGDDDFAFMHFSTIAELYPDSRYGLQAQLAQGEYYFRHDDLSMASKAFQNVISTYPRREQTLVAVAYLFKIAQIQNNTQDLKIYSTQAASFNQWTFVFNEKKSYLFVSGFGHKHKLIFTINAIELYVDGKLFTKIPL